MFNLNEGNRYVMAQNPYDMRMGDDRMCGHVRSVGLDPTNGDIFTAICKDLKALAAWLPTLSNP